MTRTQSKYPTLIICGLLLTTAASQLACTSYGGWTGRGAPLGRRGSARTEVIKDAQKATDYGPPTHLADLEDPAVKESSGIVASRQHAGLFWTHNDSGDGPFLYLFDRGGKSRGVWRVSDAKAVDWEDIAAGPGPIAGRNYLYIADTGDNDRERTEVVVYRVAEPSDAGEAAASTKKNPRTTEPAEAIRLKYPDGAHDAEALLVHPRTGDLYIVTKNVGAPSGVYKLSAPFKASGTLKLVRVGEIRLPSLFGGLITGGDISPGGDAVVLCDYFTAYEIRMLNASPAAFDKIWTQPPLAVELGEREQGESICYGADGGAIFATSEKRPTPLIEVRRLKREKQDKSR